METKIQTEKAMPVSKTENLKIIAWLDKDSPELERAYNALPGGGIAFHSGAMEQWHYLGTGRTELGTYVHSFRHRCHPYTNERMYRSIVAPAGFQPSPTEWRGQ